MACRLGSGSVSELDACSFGFCSCSILRWSDAVNPAKRLGELSWLSVTDPVRYIPNCEPVFCQELSCFLHANAGQILAECGASNFRECSLQLAARRCNAAGDVVKLKIVAILELNKFADFLEQPGAVADRRGALDWHNCFTG